MTAAEANAKQVAAILVDQCVSCHGPEQKKGGPRSEPAGDGPEGGQERDGHRAGIARREPAGRQG